jgi:hypothetical protein
MTSNPLSSRRPRVLRGLAALAGGLIVSSAVLAGVFYPDGATTLHFAFEGSPDGDRPIVRPPAAYRAEDGFGFVDSPGLVGTARGVTAPKYFRFDVNLPAGTYDVTVALGGAREDSTFTIKAADLAPGVSDVHLTRGQSLVKTFPVTVHRGTAGESRLSLEFEGTNPSLMKLDVRPVAQPSAR